MSELNWIVKIRKRTTHETLVSIIVRASLILFALLVACAISSMSLGQTKSSASSSPMIYEGFTEPKYDIMVAASEIGRLASLDVEVGDRVAQGQVLGGLEDALQISSVRIAKRQTEMSGELEAAKAEADLQQLRVQSLRQLASESMARPDELKRAETDLRIAEARDLAAKEQLTLRRLELERYQLQLERRKIRAPMDGVISQIFHQPGEYITPSDPAIVRLLVIDKLFAVFNVPVEDTKTIRPGTPVNVFLRSRSKTLEASVTSVAPDIDGESGTVQIRVELDNAYGDLLVGDRCTLRLSPKSARRMTQLPAKLPSVGSSR